MTRDDIATYISKKLGQVDAYSIGLIDTFLQTRFNMLWDAESWRDTQKVTTATATAQTVAFPTDVNRILSIRIAGNFVDPVDATFVIETDSTFFEDTGVPKYYEDFTDTADGLRKLRLYPTPSSSTALLIVGKRPCPILGSTDEPALILRNSENALIAYAMGDMLERQRQAGKAQAKFQEAASHLTEMRAVEQKQADLSRQNRTLSPNGDTLGDYINDVQARVNLYDPANRIRIKQSIRRTYQAIWDSYLWRETLIQGAGSYSGATGVVTLPSGMERAISVRFVDTAIEALESATLFDVDPTIFEASGIPTSFTDQRTVGGVNQIALHPIPSGSGTVLILGKRALIPLDDESDIPVLRNCANALITGATADMLGRIQGADPSMATALKAESAAHVTTMQSLQDEQSMRRRQGKNLTVSGNSLAEMTDAVLARCGVWDIENAIMAKEFLRRQYRAVWDRAIWKESHVIASVQTDGQTMILPDIFERVVNVRTDDKRTLMPTNMEFLFAVDPQIFEASGLPVGFSQLTAVGVRVLPTAELLTFVSASSGDKSLVFVRGESGGLEVTETITLNGTTPVSTAFAYDVPLTVAKSLTAGNVTVKGATTTTTLLVLLASERERKHLRLWIHPSSTTCGANYLVLGKRKLHPLMTDQDTPLLRDCSDCLIHAAAGDLFAMMGKGDQATDARAQAAAALQTLIDLERNQNADMPILVPYNSQQYPWSEYDDQSVGCWQ